MDDFGVPYNMPKSYQLMKPRAGLNKAEPPPAPNHNPAIWNLVIVDMAQRDIEGAKKYGTRLQPFNGRDALVDAYQEALDLVVYLRQAIYERDGERAAKNASGV
jgi:hypothetical protein